MRAASIAWTVAGTWIAWTGCVSRYRPRSPASVFVSTSVRAVEQGLGLAVDPVEVLEDHEERLLARFSQQQPLHGVERELATLSRVEGPPRSIVHGDVEQGQQRRQRRLQGSVQGEQLARHLLADLPE